jgi:hypothetical protein
MKGIRSHGFLIAAFIFVSFMASSCAYRPKFKLIDGIPATVFQQLVKDKHNNPQPLVEGTTGVTITYLGSGGFLFERGDDIILTGPFLSHHWYLRLGLWKVRSDEKLVHRVLSPKSASLAKAEAVLIGHGHYDHLLDIPYIMETFCPSATVYGNTTVTNILDAKANIATQPVDHLAERSCGSSGQWTYNAKETIRFMPIASHHAPNLKGITIAKGSVSKPLRHFPSKAGGMKEGETFAYMIDFLNPVFQDSIDFRIYYQDAADSPQPFHTLSRNPQGGNRNIDLAIVCVASFTEAPGNDYPETLEYILKPKRYLLSHWENFFLPWSDSIQKLRAVPFTDPDQFVARLKCANPKAAWIMPAPNTRLAY